jgi:MoaA/NifB/PqqE/SkfB family radical SAM enzyme
MYTERENRDLTAPELISLIDEAHSLGTRIVNFGAGEPLMRNDIEEVIDHARAKGIECRMNTNGHLVPQRLSAVKKLSSLCISIDGDEEAHDQRKGKGSFQKVLSAIKIAKTNNIAVHTTTMLSRDNVHTIDFIIKLAKKMGFFVEFLLPFFQSPDGFAASESSYREGLRKIISYKKKGYPVFFSLKAHQYALNWPNYKQKSIWNKVPKEFGKHINCFAGRYMCVVDSDGMVYPCAQMIGGHSALNYLEYGFKRCWEHIRDHNCKTCYALISFNDYNLLFRLDPAVVFNHVKNVLCESLWQGKRIKK